MSDSFARFCAKSWLTVDRSKSEVNVVDDGQVEPGNSPFGSKPFNSENFYTLRKAQVLIEKRRQACNKVTPHNATRYRPQTPESAIKVELESDYALTFKLDHLMATIQYASQIY